MNSISNSNEVVVYLRFDSETIDFYNDFLKECDHFIVKNKIEVIPIKDLTFVKLYYLQNDNKNFHWYYSEFCESAEITEDEFKEVAVKDAKRKILKYDTSENMLQNYTLKPTPTSKRNPPKRRRNINLNLKITEQCNERLNELANEKGVPKTYVIEQMILENGKTKNIKREEAVQTNQANEELTQSIEALCGELNKIGININQIAHQMNKMSCDREPLKVENAVEAFNACMKVIDVLYETRDYYKVLIGKLRGKENGHVESYPT